MAVSNIWPKDKGSGIGILPGHICCIYIYLTLWSQECGVMVIQKAQHKSMGCGF